MASFAFVLGIIWQIEKEKINEFYNKHYIFSLVLSIVMFIGSFGILFLNRIYELNNVFLNFVINNVVSLTSTVLIVTLLRIFKPQKKYWEFLGKISLEIYVLQQVIWRVLRSDIVYINNNIIWSVTVIFITIAVACIANIVNKNISKFLKKSCNKNIDRT